MCEGKLDHSDAEIGLHANWRGGKSTNKNEAKETTIKYPVEPIIFQGIVPSAANHLEILA